MSIVYTMRTAAVSLAAVVSTAACLGDAATAGDAGGGARRTDAERAAARKAFNERYGMNFRRPGTGTGSTGFVIVGEALDESEVSTVVNTIGKQLKHEQKILRHAALDGLPTRELVADKGIDVGVFVVSDGRLPPMLVAPEERWALVNVSRLREGLKDDAVGRRLYAARCRGELQRAFCYAAGCGSSQFDRNIMDISAVEEIDSLNPDMTVGDTMALCRKYLASIKVTQPVMVTYGRAVREGWAPAPTNEYQKAIWDKIHAMPTEPIKIKPETKKVAD